MSLDNNRYNEIKRSPSNPLFSIIIPNKDRISELDRAIKSVLDQTHKNIEILVVDDSDQKCFEHIKMKYNTNRNISVIRGEGKGDGGARLKGLRACNGQFVIFLDSDDELEPTKLNQHINLWKTNPSIGLSWDDTLETYDNLEPQTIPVPITIPSNRVLIKPRTIESLLLAGNFIHMSSGVTTKKIAMEVINKHYFTSSFDYYLWLYITLDYDAYYLKERLTIKHCEGGNRLGKNEVGLLKEWFATLHTDSELMKLYRDRYKEGGFLMGLRHIVITFGISTRLSKIIPSSIRNNIRNRSN